MRNIAYFISLSLILSLSTSCLHKEIFHICFIGEFSGSDNGLAVSARDGALLAIEKFNSTHARNDIHFKLTSKDIGVVPKNEAVKMDAFLSELHCDAVIGPMLSETALNIVPVINKHKIVMMSPTTSTDKLSNLDDYFFRVYPTIDSITKNISSFIYSKGSRNVMVAYDTNNFAFSERYFQMFKLAFAKNPGVSIESTPYSSTAVKFKDLILSFDKKKFDSLLVIANSHDLSLIASNFRQRYKKLPIYSSEWGITSMKFQRFIGDRANGIKSLTTFNPDDQSEYYLTFLADFINRYHNEPDFAVIKGYESAQVLMKALTNCRDHQKLKDEIIKMKQFKGVQYDLLFSPTGDVGGIGVPVEVWDHHLQLSL
jgi:branched-chain amino acid transport system substrate-binding protein